MTKMGRPNALLYILCETIPKLSKRRPSFKLVVLLPHQVLVAFHRSAGQQKQALLGETSPQIEWGMIILYTSKQHFLADKKTVSKSLLNLRRRTYRGGWLEHTPAPRGSRHGASIDRG
jgi:hypothetical protein